MSQNTALTEYYKNLLIMQYRDKVKALGHIDNVVRAGMIFDIMIAVRDGYNIETAVGAQQDVLGRILGVSRTITGTTFTRAYYGYALYGDTAPFTFKPMMLYGSVAPDVQFRNYTEGEQSLYDLTDEEYRIIQKLAVVRNMSNASVKSIDDILNVLFGAECYFMDRMNMTIVSYMVGAKWSRIFTIAKSSGLLPNPAGVGTSLVVVPDINNIFSYSLYGGGKPAFAVGYLNYFEVWSEEGASLDISCEYNPSITALTDSRIAFIDSGNILRCYTDNGIFWEQAGNGLLITGAVYPTITALSDSRIAFVDSFNHKLTAYDFDGTDFTQVGNSLTLSAIGFPSISALSTTEIAFFDGYNNELRKYTFDGTNWSLTGNAHYVSSAGNGAVCVMTSSRVSLVTSYNAKLTTYDFDGTNWGQVGSQANRDTTNYPITTRMSDTRIAFTGETIPTLRLLDFDGTNWTEKVSFFDLTGVYEPAISSLTETKIAFVDQAGKSLKKYDFAKNTKGCMASYS